MVTNPLDYAASSAVDPLLEFPFVLLRPAAIGWPVDCRWPLVFLPGDHAGFPVLDLALAPHPAVSLVVIHEALRVEGVAALEAIRPDLGNRGRNESFGFW